MSSTQRDLTNLSISESFYRIMQTDPVDDKTLLDGTGSLVTTLAVSGTIETFNLETYGTGSFSGIHSFTGSLVIPSGSSNSSLPRVGSIMTSGSNVYIYL